MYATSLTHVTFSTQEGKRHQLRTNVLPFARNKYPSRNCGSCAHGGHCGDRGCRRSFTVRAQETVHTESHDIGRRVALSLLGVSALVPLRQQQAIAGPTQAFPDIASTVLGKPETDPRLLLRNSLPVNLSDNPLIEVDNNLLAIGGHSARSAAGSRSIAQSELISQKASEVDPQALAVGIRRANNVLRSSHDEILSSIPVSNQVKAQSLMQELSDGLGVWETSIGSQPNPQKVMDLKNDMLNISSQIQGLTVDPSAVVVPEEYSSLAQLKGRAVAEMVIRSENSGDRRTMTVVLDGLNAPVTAGTFANLVNQGFYNNMPIQRSDGFVVQSGESKEKESSLPTIPMEVKFEGEPEVTYGATKDELGLLRKQVALPFNALGTLAMAREEFESNSANSQFFFLNKESEVTPSGANVLDGNYAVFGYVVENQNVLSDLKVGDKIESVRLTYGADSVIPPRNTA